MDWRGGWVGPVASLRIVTGLKHWLFSPLFHCNMVSLELWLGIKLSDRLVTLG
jgi:hypothetical protein